LFGIIVFLLLFPLHNIGAARKRRPPGSERINISAHSSINLALAADEGGNYS
jgi:hypothetical protein